MARAKYVGQLMTKDVVAVSSQTSFAEVYDLMDSHRIRQLPVTDANNNNELLGLISQRELRAQWLFEFQHLPTGGLRKILATHPINFASASSLVTVTEETSLIEAAELMLEHKLDCLPVVDGIHLRGILTESDFIKHYINRTETN
jgi:CBS domain-containing protein